MCPYCLHCLTEARLLTGHLPDWSVHPEQKVKYPSPDDPEKNIKKFKAVVKTLPVPLVLYADFEAFLVPTEETKVSASNTKVRQLHKPSGFACLRVSQVPEVNGKIFTYSGENSMTVFFEHIKNQDRYVRSIISDMKPMKTLTEAQQLQHAAATTCELCHGQFTKKNMKTKHHCHLSGLYIGPYCNTCNLKLKYKKGSNSDPTDEKKKASKRKQTKFFNGTFRKFIKRAEDIAKNNDDLDTTDYMMTEDSYMIPVIFHNLKGYDSHLIMQYIIREYAPWSIDVIPTSSEKFLSFQIDNLRFLYSLQFFTAFLDTLVQSLAADEKDKFSHIARHYPYSDLVFAKGN